MQLLLLRLLQGIMEPEKLQARKRLTHNILHYMMGIDKDEEKNFNPEKPYLMKEDEMFYYIAIFAKSGIRTVIPCSKRWAFTNQIKNQLKLFKNEKENNHRVSGNNNRKPNKETLCETEC